ncbi:MAG: hypothetical protein C5B48_06695 [Candidatus Rokuibacteriota bacterium]|nr:MAG: hypothetical protein C5B48_06695 [Candidatus Rokubacteria bacterium]
MTEGRDRPPIKERAHSAARASKTWGGYGWFMSFGTFLPLPIFLGGYLVNVTLVGAPLARSIYRFALFLTTLGQAPPGQDKVKARTQAKGDKKPLGERIRPYSPPGQLERRARPVSMPFRIIWFVLVGWWAGAVWVVIAWSVLLLPYPLLDLIRSLLADLPSVMTLAYPSAASGVVTPRTAPAS